MNVSVGVIVHNEERNIGRLLDVLLKQKTQTVSITDILVISSESTDRTNSIVSGFSKKDKRIRFIEEPERTGKFNAVNIFLKESRNNTIFLISGDVIPEEDCVEKLCSVLTGDIGISAGSPVPVRHPGLVGGVADLQWRIHNRISLKTPKFGEAIAFKRVFERIGKTAVDEEFIGMLVKSYGLKSICVPDAVINNVGPRTLKDFIKQRRRIYAGHLGLGRGSGYSPPTMNNTRILKEALSVKDVGLILLLGAMIMEMVSRFFGMCDFLLKRDKHVVWDMIER